MILQITVFLAFVGTSLAQGKSRLFHQKILLLDQIVVTFTKGYEERVQKVLYNGLFYFLSSLFQCQAGEKGDRKCKIFSKKRVIQTHGSSFCGESAFMMLETDERTVICDFKQDFLGHLLFMVIIAFLSNDCMK